MQYPAVLFVVAAYFLSGIEAQNRRFPYERLLGNGADQNMVALQNLYVQSPQVPDCPLEIHPDTETMFIMRGPLGDPQPRTCPAGTYFLRSVCSCVNRPSIENGKTPLTECNLRPSAIGAAWYEENVFGIWVQRPCGPGSAYNPATCDCSITL
ncbi:hypothetical protein ACF0H5_018070 [Mactra antiquata]